MKRREDKGRLPPFVPLLKETLASPAWRAMSNGARSLYVALKLRYSSGFKNNGRIYLSQRDAVKELGSGFTEIARWFRELQHYGFIVMTEPGCLGVDGKGKAPHWRLTEVGYMRDPPTRDFMRWNGGRFSKHWPGGDDKKPKQNPAPENRSTPLQKTGAPLLQKTRAVRGKPAPENRSIQAPPPAPENRSISRVPSTGAAAGPPALKVIAGGKGRRPKRKRAGGA
jgi:hypothetical protein